MTTKELALADKLLDAAFKSDSALVTSQLLSQYESLIRSACGRKSADETDMKDETYLLPARFVIGERVKVSVISTSPIYGYVRAIIITASKVKYSIWVKEAATTLHNIDSIYIDEVLESEREIIDMPADNYS